MPTQTDWAIVFFIEDNGTSPVEEFILSQDERTQARFRWSLEQLRARNVMAREPLAKHIEGKVYELRVESQTNIFRVMYFFATGKQIVLLNGFQKKTQKTPNREIAMALKRMNRFIQRRGES